MNSINNINLAQSELLELKNLGMASVNILQAIGINTYEDLAEVGPVNAYRKIKDRGIHVSKVMLYALQGALMDVHWNDLPPELKTQLVKQVSLVESRDPASTPA
jgi:DNA transformation protein and related proteins